MTCYGNILIIFSVQAIPQNVKDLYKTVWEISQKTVLQQAADRGAFIDQSQSLNVHIAEPNFGKMSSMHFFGWRLGLKTGMYYLRTKPAANAIQFTVDKTKAKAALAAQNDSKVSLRIMYRYRMYRCCVVDPDSNWAKIQDPDPNSMS